MLRLRSWIIAALIAVPLVALGSTADSCIRFKKPGGSVPPGMREPSDPAPEPPASDPTDPPPPPPGDTTPGSGPKGPTTPSNLPPKAPTTPPSTGDGPTRGKQAVDDTTWETWWELNRIDYFPRRWVAPVVTNDGPRYAGPQHVSAELVEAKLFPVLRKLVDDKQVFVQEAALITMGRTAASESQRAEAREILLKKISHKNHLIARAAALGLFYVADENSVRPMYLVAKDPKAEDDVRAFLALTLTALKSPMSGELLKDLASSKESAFELAAAAYMALGFNGIESDPTLAEFLDEKSKDKELRVEFRAEAIESFGRIGDFAIGQARLRKALSDKDEDVRRSATLALGVLDYRTPAEIQIAAIRAPYDAIVGAPVPPAKEQQISALETLIQTQRQEMSKDVKEVVRALTEAMVKDGDGFVNRMAAISLGRIAATTGNQDAIKHLEAAYKKDQVGMREYCLLALAIAKAPSAHELAAEALTGKNRPPTTRGAACIAFGILGDPKADEMLRNVIDNDAHPYIRGYAALGLGMVGTPSSLKNIQQMLRTTRSPVSRAYAALGLALLGTNQAADDIVSIIKTDEVRDGFVASHMVYALGLTKDRRPATFDALLAKAQDDSDMYVQAATVAAIGYLSTGEFYPKRHLMAKGFNYLMNLDLVSNYFYKL
jgi:HEAT repeat protein